MKLLFTINEARAAIGCGQTRIYAMLASGQLEARRWGKRTLITAESLNGFVESLPKAETPTMRGEAGPRSAVDRLKGDAGPAA